MGGMSRSKGTRAEREVERVIEERKMFNGRELGGRRQMAGDITLEGFAFDVKRQEKLQLDKWSRRIEEDCPPHLTPGVIYRRSREPWRVSLRLEDYLDLLEEARR